MEARVHIHLSASDLAASRRFYETFFGVAPVKVREGYAKFLPGFAPVNLAITQSAPADAGHRPVNHLGVELDSSEAVFQHLARVRAAGLSVRVQERVNCCHANQDKFWVTDPDGTQWEVYHLNYDLEDDSLVPAGAAPPAPGPHALPVIDESSSCCAPRATR